MADEQLQLPGVGPAPDHSSAMVVACHLTIEALREADKLRPEHALLTQLLLELSEAIDRGRRSGRASAVAMAARELRDTLLQIDPPPEEGEVGDKARELLADFMKAAETYANTGQMPAGWGDTTS